MTKNKTTTTSLKADRQATTAPSRAERRRLGAADNNTGEASRFTAASRHREIPRDQTSSSGSALAGAVAQRPGRIGRASQAGIGFRSASETRVLALVLQRDPIPDLTKGAIAGRWRVGPDTVRNVLRDFDVYPGVGNDLEIPLTDLLLCEGISNPLETWIFAGSAGREILSADLLTLEEWLAQDPEKAADDKSKYYRELSDGQFPSIRIGIQHRSRPTFQDAQSSDASDREARA